MCVFFFFSSQQYITKKPCPSHTFSFPSLPSTLALGGKSLRHTLSMSCSSQLWLPPPEGVWNLPGLSKPKSYLVLVTIRSVDFTPFQFSVFSKCCMFMYFSVVKSESRSVVSNSLRGHELYNPWNSPGQNTGGGSLSLLQGIFHTQGSNLGLPHCRWILYQLSHKRSPRILEWVPYPYSRGSSWFRNQTGSPALQADSLPIELSRKPFSL